MPLLVFRIYTYRSNMFWNHMIKSAYWRALCKKILKVCLSVFVYITVSQDLVCTGPSGVIK